MLQSKIIGLTFYICQLERSNYLDSRSKLYVCNIKTTWIITIYVENMFLSIIKNSVIQWHSQYFQYGVYSKLKKENILLAHSNFHKINRYKSKQISYKMSQPLHNSSKRTTRLYNQMQKSYIAKIGNEKDTIETNTYF